MKTIKFCMWILVFGFFFTNCNEESDYQFPEMDVVEGQISTKSEGGEMLFAFNPHNHKSFQVPALNSLIGSLSCLSSIDAEHSFLKVNKLTYLPEQFIFEMNTEIKIVSFEEGGFYFHGPMYLSSDGTLTGEFNIGRTYGKFIGAMGALHFVGEIDFEKRAMEIDVSGNMCEIDESPF